MSERLFCCMFLRKGKLSTSLSQRALVDKPFPGGGPPWEVKPGQLGAGVNFLKSLGEL